MVKKSKDTEQTEDVTVTVASSAPIGTVPADVLAMNVYQRIHAVMSEIGTLSKDGTNAYHKYKYVSEAQFVKAVQPLLIKYRLVMTPKTLNISPDQKKEDLVYTVLEYTIVNIDDPGQSVLVSAVGSGMDSGDKAAMKATTAAKKTILSHTFMVATGDDAEADVSVDKKAAERSFAKKPATVDTATATKSSNGSTGFHSAVTSKNVSVNDSNGFGV
jgi:hypothetical protein